MTGGFVHKLLWVDLTSGQIDERQLGREVERHYLGGKGLAARVLFDEIRAGIDPLGPENVLIFSTGPMTGIPLAGGVKFCLASKSPQTGTWNDAATSGFWGSQLKFAGYDAVVIKGRAGRPVYLSITSNGAEIRPAEHLWGMNCRETDEALKAELGDERLSTAVIGRAGERLIRYACPTVDVWRQPGRGGNGAVMGSKNLKAATVRGTGRVPVADASALQALRDQLHNDLRSQVDRWNVKHNVVEEGTNEFLDEEIRLGVTPYRNYQTTAQVPMQEALRSRTVDNRACPGCVQTCWCVRAVDEGPYAGTQGVGPEYESLACLGPVCGITDIPTLIKANLMVNEYGMDSVSTGASIAFAMECYENGILTKDDVGGIDLRFGNTEALIKMIGMIGERQGIGELLGEGTMRASQKIGKGSHRYAVHTKGLEYPGYMPKIFPGMALALATADRGACHLRAWISEEVFTHTLGVGDLGADELRRRAELVAETQNMMAWLNGLGMCTHNAYFYYYPTLPRVVQAVVGWDIDLDDLLGIGERVYTLTRLFNVREGFTRKDDALPWRFTHEPVPDGRFKGLYIKPEQFDAMLDHYYEARGWDKDGIPTPETLGRLGLESPGF